MGSFGTCLGVVVPAIITWPAVCCSPCCQEAELSAAKLELIPPLHAAAYAAKKAELAEERRRREAEREAAKEARKQRMRDYMEKNLLEVGAFVCWHLV